jgi:class 3 adenylate cyclase
VTSPSPQTRGFLFADLRGYSAFTERYGDRAAAELLGRYRELVRREIDAFHGAEVRTEGDSFYVVFGSVSEAVQAGVAIRDAAPRSAGEHPIHVGIGIHAGETTDGEQGIVSTAVNIAARVCAAAEPGEVLVTDTVRSLTRGVLDVRFAPRGSRRLKGIAEPVAVFAVRRADEERDARDRALRDRRLMLAGGVVGAGVLVVAALLLGSGLPEGPPGASGSAGPSTSPRVSASPAPSASGAVAAFPDEAEADLLDRIPEAIARTCERADREATPTYRDSALAGIPPRVVTTVRTMPVVAGLSCLLDTTRVVYWQAPDAQSIESIFYQHVGARGIAAGDCSETPDVWGPWSSGANSGLVACSFTEGTAAAIEWTYGDDPLYATAVRRDGDPEELYAWWRDIGRLLSR